MRPWVHSDFHCKINFLFYFILFSRNNFLSYSIIVLKIIIIFYLWTIKKITFFLILILLLKNITGYDSDIWLPMLLGLQCLSYQISHYVVTGRYKKGPDSAFCIAPCMLYKLGLNVNNTCVVLDSRICSSWLSVICQNMAAEKEREKFTKTDMERVALFQEMGYVTIGDKYKSPGSGMSISLFLVCLCLSQTTCQFF